jgi:hypothetical protein
MFAAGALPPRTKRWAEARVLADCIAVKVTLHPSAWSWSRQDELTAAVRL